MKMKTTRKPAVIVAAAVAAIGVVTFSATYALRGSDPVSRAASGTVTPDRTATPDPNVTPDTTQPYWYAPYINADAQSPAFRGELNGLRIDPDWEGRTGFDFCPGTGMEPAAPRTEIETVAAPGPLQIDPKALPAGIVPTSAPEAFLCRGALTQDSWTFTVAPGTPDVNEGGSNLFIARFRGLEPIAHPGPAERWRPAMVNGLPAVVLDSIVSVGTKQFGGCFAAVYDQERDVMTTVNAGAANGPFCQRIAEVVAK